jgi:hypothetical protein
MNIKEHYSKLYNESIYNISTDKYEIDNLIDSKFDQRFGITLLIRPSNEVKDKIQKFINELKEVTAVLRDLGFRLNLKIVLCLENLCLMEKSPSLSRDCIA